MIGPGNEGTIAGDFWCVAFDERRGRSRLSDQVVGMGTAAAVLSELVVSGHLAVSGEGEVFVLDAAPPVEQVGGNTFRTMSQNRDERDLTTWIKYLALNSYHEVGGRLVAAGAVRPIRASGVRAGLRRAVGGGVRIDYQPVNGTLLAWPGVRLGNTLSGDPGTPLTLPDLVCAGLAVATGAIDAVLWDADRHARARRDLPALLARLPPALAMVLARTESAVGDAVLTQRT